MGRFLRNGAGLILVLAAALTLWANFQTQAAPVQPELVERQAPPAAVVATTATSTTNIPVFDWYPVVRVIDGDTIVVLMNGKNVTVRLIGLDTPETVDKRMPVQCFGKEASEKMKKVISGQSVRIETDYSQGVPCFAEAAQGRCDKYGRLLAYVYAPANVRPEGILVNMYMIAEGYGHEYTYNLPYKYQSEFKAAQIQARQEKKGLWADGVCGSQS